MRLEGGDQKLIHFIQPIFPDTKLITHSSGFCKFFPPFHHLAISISNIFIYPLSNGRGRVDSTENENYHPLLAVIAIIQSVLCFFFPSYKMMNLSIMIHGLITYHKLNHSHPSWQFPSHLYNFRFSTGDIYLKIQTIGLYYGLFCVFYCLINMSASNYVIMCCLLASQISLLGCPIQYYQCDIPLRKYRMIFPV